MATESTSPDATPPAIHPDGTIRFRRPSTYRLARAFQGYREIFGVYPTVYVMGTWYAENQGSLIFTDFVPVTHVTEYWIGALYRDFVYTLHHPGTGGLWIAEFRKPDSTPHTD